MDGSEALVRRLDHIRTPLPPAVFNRASCAPERYLSGPPGGSLLTTEGCDSYATTRCRATLYECEALSHQGGGAGGDRWVTV